MKVKIVFGLLLFMGFISSACQPDIENEFIPDVPKEGEQFTISLGTDGYDMNDVTRATAKTIYGINVEYYRNGVRQGYYAYGLFDDLSNAKLTLIGGYTYTFTCSIARPSSQSLWNGPYGGNSFSGYAAPFQLDNSVSTLVSNSFVTGTDNYLSGLALGKAVVKDAKQSSGYSLLSYPSIERFYGVYSGFNPATDGSRVTIPVNKAYFGCKLILKGVEGGSLTTSCSDTGMTFLSATTRGADKEGIPTIYTFTDVASCWTNADYSKTVTLNYTYTSDRHNSTSKDWWDLKGSKSITFKRNVMTTVTVSVNPDLSGAQFGVIEEPFGEDNEIVFEVDENGNLYEVETDVQK